MSHDEWENSIITIYGKKRRGDRTFPVRNWNLIEGC